MKPVTIEVGGDPATLQPPPPSTIFRLARQIGSAYQDIGEDDRVMVAWACAGLLAHADPLPEQWDGRKGGDLIAFGEVTYNELRARGWSFEEVKAAGWAVFTAILADINPPPAAEVKEARDFTPAQQDEAA